ncbi:hypothetical protein LCGC14_2297370 [marine sediment metagenome]|uniref:Uncharacterized protein n=1 Tax=marine sediment metagenome TaxID=412755 RepID=A0A0F9FJN5_9ZZZZ
MGAPVSVSNVPLPSRSHSYVSIVPSGSLEADPSNVTVCPACAGFGETPNEAVGRCWTIRVLDVVLLRLSSSVTLSRTVIVPGAKYEREVVGYSPALVNSNPSMPVKGSPSRSHSYVSTCRRGRSRLTRRR